MAVGKGSAGTGLEVLLEGKSFLIVFELDLHDKAPGFVFRGVRRLAGVVEFDKLLSSLLA